MVSCGTGTSPMPFKSLPESTSDHREVGAELAGDVSRGRGSPKDRPQDINALSYIESTIGPST